MRQRLKLNFLTILVCTILTKGNCQNNFEKLFYYADLSIGQHILRSSDGDYLFAAGGHDAFNDHSYFTKIDEFGNIIWKKDYPTPMLASGKFCLELRNGNLMMVAEEGVVDPLRPHSYCLSPAGNPIWDCGYPGPHSAPYYYRYANHCRESLDSGTVITGMREESITEKKCFVLKLTKNGSVDWYKEILPLYNLSGKSILSTPDSGYILLTNYTFAFASELVRLDSAGNVLWNKFIPNFHGQTNLLTHVSTSLVSDGFGNYIATGSAKNGAGLNRPCMIKFSATGDTLWRRELVSTVLGEVEGHSSIINNANSYSIAVKMEKDTSGNFLAAVVHTDSVLNIASIDTVDLTRTRNAQFSLNINSAPLGYCLVGTVDTAGGFPTRAFVKVKSSASGSGIYGRDESASITLYPNPVSEILYIANTEQYNRDAFIEVFDNSGKRVFQSQLVNLRNGYEIDCRQLKAGTYYCRIYTDTVYSTGKFVIK